MLLTTDEICNIGSEVVAKCAHNRNSDCYEAELTQAIAKAQLKKVIEWGCEPCTEHKHNSVNGLMYVDNIMANPIFLWNKEGIYYINRKDCPECWEKIKKEVE